jgi:hypothetical protein
MTSYRPSTAAALIAHFVNPASRSIPLKLALFKRRWSIPVELFDQLLVGRRRNFASPLDQPICEGHRFGPRDASAPGLPSIPDGLEMSS